MEWVKFQTRVPGKWVLAGEHSVLKGAAAVALPHPELGLSLVFDPHSSSDALSVSPPEANAILNELLGSMGENVKSQGLSLKQPQGKVQIESTIPVGAGLGSSAALCVALTQWVSSFLGLDDHKAIELATRLEDRFHGKSSGMDVAVISARQPIAYTMAHGIRPISVKHLPKFTFHDTGLRSSTRTCIERVEKFRHDLPQVAALVDSRMESASQSAVEGLAAFDAGKRTQGLHLIADAMRNARECFYSWELVPGEAQRLEESLLKQGALAVKITGAGGGGMVVALWD
jgi:mevalonate kinase